MNRRYSKREGISAFQAVLVQFHLFLIRQLHGIGPIILCGSYICAINVSDPPHLARRSLAPPILLDCQCVFDEINEHYHSEACVRLGTGLRRSVLPYSCPCLYMPTFGAVPYYLYGNASRELISPRRRKFWLALRRSILVLSRLYPLLPCTNHTSISRVEMRSGSRLGHPSRAEQWGQRASASSYSPCSNVCWLALGVFWKLYGE